MTTAQVVETSVTNNSLSEDYPHPDDHAKQICFMSYSQFHKSHYLSLVILQRLFSAVSSGFTCCCFESREIYRWQPKGPFTLAIYAAISRRVLAQESPVVYTGDLKSQQKSPVYKRVFLVLHVKLPVYYNLAEILRKRRGTITVYPAWFCDSIAVVGRCIRSTFPLQVTY